MNKFVKAIHKYNTGFGRRSSSPQYKLYLGPYTLKFVVYNRFIYEKLTYINILILCTTFEVLSWCFFFVCLFFCLQFLTQGAAAIC